MGEMQALPRLVSSASSVPAIRHLKSSKLDIIHAMHVNSTTTECFDVPRQ